MVVLNTELAAEKSRPALSSVFRSSSSACVLHLSIRLTLRWIFTHRAQQTRPQFEMRFTQFCNLWNVICRGSSCLVNDSWLYGKKNTLVRTDIPQEPVISYRNEYKYYCLSKTCSFLLITEVIPHEKVRV